MAELVGTFACPICGYDKPHNHSEDEIKFRPDQTAWRIGRLVEELRRPGVTFYEGMRRVYGTHYGHLAEKALIRELENVIPKIGATGHE